MTGTNFRESQLFFLFERNKNIRKKVFLFEEALEKEFITPFTINSISDEDNADIVRLQTISLNKFSILSITQNKLLLKTNYSSDFQNDTTKIKDYLFKKAELFREVLKDEKLEFFGIISLIDIELKQEEVLEFLKNKTGINVIDDETLDFSYFYSKKYKEKYFINTNVSKFTYLKGEILQDRAGETQKEHMENITGVVINVDFNNKPEFLENKPILFNDFNAFLENYFSLLNHNDFDDFVIGNIKY